MPEIKGDTLENKRRGFFKFISYRIFKEVLTETETIDKISELEIPYYVLIDEFQYIFTDNELLNVTKDFFQNISSSKVRYVTVGTFILVDLLNDDGELISPFNKASFKLMNLFDRRENGLTAEIIKESCGHPASFMILLKLYHDLRPTVNKWGIKLQERLTEYMNGTHIKIKHEINRMDDDEKQYLRGLVEYMADHWYMDLSDLTALDDTVKKLLNFGILNIMDTNSVEDDISCDPVDLLMLGLSYIEPTIVADNRVLNKEGVGERIMQASLFCIFNDLLPRPKMCLLEVIKHPNLTSRTPKERIKAGSSYANHYGMDITLSTSIQATSSKKKLPDVKMSALLPNKPDFWPDDRAIPLDLVTVIESELALHREENARLMAKITGLEFKKAELIERVAKLEEKQLENVVIKNLLHASCEKYNHINKQGLKCGAGISAISNVISEKFVLNSPAIPEDPMEGIEDSAIPRNQLLCTKCLEEITADFPKRYCLFILQTRRFENHPEKRSNDSTEKSSSKKAKKKWWEDHVRKLIEELISETSQDPEIAKEGDPPFGIG
ncbi:hypothetical protein GLOIN_2v1735228 [Rhizophagus clarus]|uniref:Uncharacterized protein n=1 Tax=Rhizophagus clarus TaxID=94130 RepID=A0A8H3QYR9_9GLOM|nr:hypothetical protein GLOIN_2v1735228 [Rhizophagus clarus]